MIEKANKEARVTGLHPDKEKTIKTLDDSFNQGLRHTLSDADADSTEDCRVLSRYSSISDLRHFFWVKMNTGFGKPFCFCNREIVILVTSKYSANWLILKKLRSILLSSITYTFKRMELYITKCIFYATHHKIKKYIEKTCCIFSYILLHLVIDRIC